MANKDVIVVVASTTLNDATKVNTFSSLSSLKTFGDNDSDDIHNINGSGSDDNNNVNNHTNNNEMKLSEVKISKEN